MRAIKVRAEALFFARQRLNARANIICNRLYDRNVKTCDWLQVDFGTELSQSQEAGRPSSPKAVPSGKGARPMRVRHDKGRQLNIEDAAIVLFVPGIRFPW
jgi:hypothetical protein